MRNYQRKTTRVVGVKAAMQSALRAVNRGMSLRKAATFYEVNYRTLGRYAKRLEINKENIIITTFGYSSQHVQVLSDDMEKMMCDYVVRAAAIFHGLTSVKIREFAYKFATANKVKIPESWTMNKAAGIDWLRGFMKRHPHLSLRTPESTSMARVRNFTKSSVDEFYNNLSTILKRCPGFGPESIYNVDETGINTVQRLVKVVAKKGTKQVGGVVSQERGDNVTVCCAVNAIGNTIPPFFVFPRVKTQPHWLLTAPPGSKTTENANATGWMTSENFLMFMEHFVFHAKPTKEHPVLLILDNHNSHIGIDILDYAKEHFITLLSFPAHCTHALQPLDRTVYRPFKTFINQAMDEWMKQPENIGTPTFTIHLVPYFVSLAFPKAMTPSNIRAGFKCTGIFPFNPSVFFEADFTHEIPSPQTTCGSRLEKKEESEVLNTDLDHIEVFNTDLNPTQLNNIPEDRKPYFDEALRRLATCRSYKNLKTMSQHMKDEINIRNYCLPDQSSYSDQLHKLTERVDVVALDLIPDDYKSIFIPVPVLGDGNCLPRTASVLAFGNENNHVEMRTRIVIESCTNDHLYLDDSYLQGETKEVILSQIYAGYSDMYNPGIALTEDNIRDIYERERS